MFSFSPKIQLNPMSLQLRNKQKARVGQARDILLRFFEVHEYDLTRGRMKVCIYAMNMLDCRGLSKQATEERRRQFGFGVR